MRKKGAGQATDDATAAATDDDLISVVTPAASVQWSGASWSDYGAPYGVWSSISTSITSSASVSNLMTSSGDALGPASMLDPTDALLGSAPPMFQLAAFGASAGGWSSQDLYPRLLADVTNDGNADIVGFASNGVLVSAAIGNGGFQGPVLLGGLRFGVPKPAAGAARTHTRACLRTQTTTATRILWASPRVGSTWCWASGSEGFRGPRSLRGRRFGAPKPAAGAARTHTRAWLRT